MFSMLKAGSRIARHRGPYLGVIRCHIPLLVPTGDCGICVAGEVFRWQHGIPLVFVRDIRANTFSALSPKYVSAEKAHSLRLLAVMNGFRKDLFSKIMGLNGHVIITRVNGPFEDYKDAAAKVMGVPGRR